MEHYTMTYEMGNVSCHESPETLQVTEGNK